MLVEYTKVKAMNNKDFANNFAIFDMMRLDFIPAVLDYIKLAQEKVTLFP